MRIIPITCSFLLCCLTLSAQESITTEEYLNTYAEFAVDEMKRTGIPASITLGQAILESGSGNSRLAVKGKNHFGIKCHADWNGAKIYEDDDADNECFRKYEFIYESFKDHSEFLMKHSRYAFLFDLDPTDYKAWARGLKKAGYATNPKYADILIGLIERHKLYLYDSESIADTDNTFILADGTVHNYVQPGFTNNWVINPWDRERLENNGREVIIARQRDNMLALAQELGMMRWQLYKYNDMDETDTITPGQLVYLEPKRNNAEKGIEKHEVQEGETVWEISQKYGIKEKKLRKKNGLSQSEEPQPGDVLLLRESADGGFLGLF
ncbi:MAG: glucosaminidase domain-containing protein [Candidatus Delongbacteria bacterium]|nr:glucosaminidase domain-containing protein [Candidatus Delongbacteria bacterium]